ncbi:MAG: type IX secretion system membrane protein PorP/SprF [Marinifilaceae bacterium]|jgi:type IX secretion system PorP/SprF family membrane protein|nr:type IX secretion system membrane protein PorP/SprF [Marinifilaceae bacterium]
MNHKSIYIYTLLLLIFLIVSNSSYAQFENNVPSITKQEFYNPSYNSYKNYTSINLVSRQQWATGGIEGPRVVGFNLHMPVFKNTFGSGITAISEMIGHRNINTGYVNFTKDLKIGRDAHMGFGLGFGLQNEKYELSDLKFQEEEDLSKLKLNQINPSASFGIITMVSNFYLGISTTITLSDTDIDKKYLAGFDGVAGFVYEFHNDFALRGGIVAKHYIQKELTVNEDGKMSSDYVKPIIDASLFMFIKQRFWLGTSHRLEEAQTFYLSYRFGRQKKYTIGYEYELGLGRGLNQFSTQGVSISINFQRKRTFRKVGNFQRKAVRYVKPLSEYLY